MAQYGDLVLGQNKTVFNPLAGVAYSTPDQLALDLGTTANKIDWGKIRVDANYTLPTSNAISLDKMKPVPDLQANLPTPTPKTDPTGATVASATQTSKSLQDYIKEITPVESETSKTEKSIVSDLLRLAPELGGKKAALAEAETATGVPELQKQLAALNSQILTGVAELNQYDTDLQKSLLDLEGKPQQLSSVVGTQQAFVQRQAAALKSAKASEVQLLQSRALGLAGEVEAAQSIAQRAIDLKYEAKEDEYNLKLQQLELIKPLLNKEQEQLAIALERKYVDEQTAMQEQKARQAKLFEFGLTKNITKPFYNLGGTVIRTSDGKAYSTPEEAAKDGVDIQKWSNVQTVTPDAGNFQVIGTTTDEYGNNQNIYGFVNEQSGKVTPLGSSNGGTWTPSQNGSLVSSNPNPSKIIDGYDFTNYATDPKWGNSVSSILNKIPNLVTANVAVNVPSTGENLDQYIKSVAKNSPITSQMIFKAAQQYNVEPKLLAAILQQESQFGTTGKGARTFNPGNVGNTDSGAEVNYGDWQSGVNAVAQNMAKRQIAGQANSSILNSNDPKSLAQTIFNGTGRLGDISTKNNLRARTSAELDKLKNQALDSGDIYGTIRASAGGKDVDATFIQSFEKGVNVLYQIADLQNAINDEKTGPILGIIRSNNPYDTKATQIKAQLQAIVPNLARGIYGEVGVLTDNDVANYAKTLPNLKSTEEVRSAILAITLKSVQRSLENKIKTAAGFGRDVSGILDMYKEIEKKVKELEGSISGQSVGITDFRSWLTNNQPDTLDTLLNNKGY